MNPVLIPGSPVPVSDLGAREPVFPTEALVLAGCALEPGYAGTWMGYPVLVLDADPFEAETALPVTAHRAALTVAVLARTRGLVYTDGAMRMAKAGARRTVMAWAAEMGDPTAEALEVAPGVRLGMATELVAGRYAPGYRLVPTVSVGGGTMVTAADLKVKGDVIAVRLVGAEAVLAVAVPGLGAELSGAARELADGTAAVLAGDWEEEAWGYGVSSAPDVPVRVEVPGGTVTVAEYAGTAVREGRARVTEAIRRANDGR